MEVNWEKIRQRCPRACQGSGGRREGATDVVGIVGVAAAMSRDKYLFHAPTQGGVGEIPLPTPSGGTQMKT